MSKPESIRGIPIPADVDADAWRAAADAMASVGWFATSMIRGAYTAILAAKAEERQAILEIVETAPLTNRSSEPATSNKIMADRIAASIRKRAEG